jgi:hypothetical protein
MATPNKNLSTPTTGSLANAWGPVLNANFTAIDAVVGGTQNVSITSGNVTLSSSEALNLRYVLTGVLTGNRQLIWPAVGGIYVVQNDCTGAFTVTLRTSASGDTVVIPQGATLTVSTDGTDMAAIDGAVASGQMVYAVDTGAADAYVVAPPLAVALKAGVTVRWAATNPNTGACTLNASGTGAAAIKTQAGADPAAGAIVAGGVYQSTYTGTVWQTQGIGYLPSGGGTIVGNLVVTGNISGVGNLTRESTDAGASAGPTIDLYRNSATPAANDALGEVKFSGEDSGGGTNNYARAYGVIVDPTAASEDGKFVVETVVAGTEAARVEVGAGLYTSGATGGDKGVNTVNASEYYWQGTKIGGPVSAQTAAASASLDFAIDAGFDYEFRLNGVTPTTNGANLTMLFSVDNGATYITTGSYSSISAQLTTAVNGSTSGTATSILLAGPINNNAGFGPSGKLDLVVGGAAAFGTSVSGHLRYIESTSGTHVQPLSGGSNATASQVTNVRFIMSSGTIAAGTIRQRAVPH